MNAQPPLVEMPNASAFVSFQQFARAYGVLVKHSRDWRLVHHTRFGAVGQIHGLPNSRGQLIATDGIECFIIRGDGSIFIGHIDFFVDDKEQDLSTMKVKEVKVKTAKPKHDEQAMSIYF